MGYTPGWGAGYGGGYAQPVYACPRCHNPVAPNMSQCPTCGYRPPAAVAKSRNASIVLALGAAGVAAGSFLPWATIGAGSLSATVSGTDGGRDGLFTLGIGIALGAIALVGMSGRGLNLGLRVLALLGGLAAAGIAAYDGADVARLGNDYNSYFQVTIGAGIYLVAIGGVVAVVAALLAWRK